MGGVTIAPEGEIWIERKRGFDYALRFIEPVKLHQSSGQLETPRGVIPVQFDRAAKQIERVLVSAKMQLGEGHHPPHPCPRRQRLFRGQWAAFFA